MLLPLPTSLHLLGVNVYPSARRYDRCAWPCSLLGDFLRKKANAFLGHVLGVLGSWLRTQGPRHPSLGCCHCARASCAGTICQCTMCAHQTHNNSVHFAVAHILLLIFSLHSLHSMRFQGRRFICLSLIRRLLRLPSLPSSTTQPVRSPPMTFNASRAPQLTAHLLDAALNVRLRRYTP